VIHYNNNTWNNNNGQAFHIPINNHPTGGGEADLHRLISAWPVPARDVLYVGVPVEFARGHSLALRSMDGLVVLSRVITAENFYLDVSALSPGFYILTVGEPGGPVKAFRKVLKGQ